MSDKKKSPFALSYEAALDDVAAFKRERADRLAAQWSDDPGARPKRPCPTCGKPVGVRAASLPRRVLTRFGEIEYRRHQHYCRRCAVSFFPRDTELGTPSDMTDDVKALIADFTVNDPFGLAAERLKLHHGLARSESAVVADFERLTTPLVTNETSSVPIPLGEAETPILVEHDGSMIRRTDGWHEANLVIAGPVGSRARIAVVDALDRKQALSRFRSAPGFAQLAQREVLWIADGARTNWALQEEVCPHARPLLDFYHAKSHASEAAKAVYGEKGEAMETARSRWIEQLWEGRVGLLIAELRQLRERLKTEETPRLAALRSVTNLIAYYEENEARMNYKEFRNHGWPIGSGEVESAHKSVLQVRMKRAGMMWSPAQAQRMAQARALYRSVGPDHFFHALQQAA